MPKQDEVPQFRVYQVIDVAPLLGHGVMMLPPQDNIDAAALEKAFKEGKGDFHRVVFAILQDVKAPQVRLVGEVTKDGIRPWFV